MEAFPTTYDAKDKTWSGPKRSSIYNSDASLGRVIFNNMKNWPRNVCQINDASGESLTYAQAITWAIRIAQHLKKRGLNDTDVVGISAKNTNYLMPLATGCLMNATPFHAVNPLLDEDTIKHAFGLTKPKIIFCDGLEYNKIKSATQGWSPEIFTMIDHVEGVPKIESLLDPTPTEMFYQPEPLKNGGDQTVAILCSSGTTGLPKAVCISNSTLLMDNVQITSEMIFYVASSLDWMTGVFALIFSTVFGCTRVITNKPFTPEYFVQLVKKYQLLYAVLPPRHLSGLAICPEATVEALSSLRLINFGGGVVSLATLQRIQELCKNAILTGGYGMTEVGGITANLGIKNINAAGKPIAGIKMRIVDDDGKRLGYNQVGEIYVHTGQPWNGYYGNPLESRRMQDFEGWFHTGDLGYFDDNNLLYIVDRKKEILKYQGLHYWPTEIETVIAELPEVQDVCVVGIYDERQGDAAGALIVKRKGYEINEKAIIEYVAKRLTGVQMQLHAGVRFTENLPANHNGKTVRRTAREVFLAVK
ncbi:uncharacterized protein LOC133843313 [Drosophila sulfurigaster albostrigata]|uniref:uncharacterized protein LOC133843313 n=1 Tax=Drosophila sulfurigaster albostrigata TaxID=89887 RepID=UPI002D21E3A1|nr:uncharacterized protein LOC133843313 [Drosophila sulfurigaster albostrigata]